jgi:ELWxxDGT repeat protein
MTIYRIIINHIRGFQIASASAALITCLHFTTAQTYSQSASQIADLNPGSSGSYPTNLTEVGNTIYFSAATDAVGRELWKYDGGQIILAADINDTSTDPALGTPVGNSSNPEWLTPFQGGLIFSAFDSRHGKELWRFDGVTASRISDISPDADDSIKTAPNSSWPSNLTVLGTNLLFTANSGTARENFELWKYDGTSVSQAANIHPDTGTNYSSYPSHLTDFKDALYFMADDGKNGFELWKYNGKSAEMLTNINPGGSSSSSFPEGFTEFDGFLYFQAFSSNAGYELWKTDGTNTYLIDINPGAGSSYPQFLTVFQNALFFRATDGIHGYELWKYDGQQASLASDINPGGDSFPKGFTVYNGALYFSADDGSHGWELWSFNGTTSSLVTDLNPAGDSFPEGLAVIGDKLYFSATTPETGDELWSYDSSAVSLAADINPGSGSSFPQSITALNDQIVFAAAGNEVSDWELWKVINTTDNGEPPRISGISIIGDSVQIGVSGGNSGVAVLQGSSNFSSWTNLGTNSLSTGSASFTDPLGPTYRFYRVLKQ